MLLQKDVPKAARFYSEGLGLPVKVLSERWAEIDAGGTTLALKAVEGCVSFAIQIRRSLPILYHVFHYVCSKFTHFSIHLLQELCFSVSQG